MNNLCNTNLELTDILSILEIYSKLKQVFKEIKEKSWIEELEKLDKQIEKGSDK